MAHRYRGVQLCEAWLRFTASGGRARGRVAYSARWCRRRAAVCVETLVPAIFPPVTGHRPPFVRFELCYCGPHAGALQARAARRGWSVVVRQLDRAA